MSDKENASQEFQRIILELGLERTLHEIALPKDKILHKLLNHQEHVIEHLVKLATAPKTRQERNHWKGELVGALGDILSLRKKKSGLKPLPYKDYYETLWSGNLEDPETGDALFQSWVKRTAQKERLTIKHSLPEVKSAVQTFFQAFCTMCAEGKRVEDNRERLIALLGTLDH